MAVQTIRIEWPSWSRFLFQRDGAWRFKGIYGGRGSGKSHTVGGALAVMGANQPERILCLRETQKSQDQSAYQNIVDRIEQYQLTGYRVLEREIRHKNGSVFWFEGLWRNDQGIRSKERVSIAWVEEAQKTSERSWDILDPTIREQGSEIWATWNPELDTDPTHKFWLINPKRRTKTVKVNWYENQWISADMREQAEECRRNDPKKYDWIWLGNCQPAVQGAIYEEQLRVAESEARIGTVPYVIGAPVNTAWDLGFGDMLSVWLWQHVGTQVRLIGYKEDRRRSVMDLIGELQQLPYVWGTDYLPWDGGSKDVGSGLSVDDRLRSVGRKPFVVPQEAVYTGIDAVRTLFPSFAFDAAQCVDGLAHLRRYAWAISSDGTYQRSPKHDEHSHAADALRTLAMGIRPPQPAALPKKWAPRPSEGSMWV